MNRRDVLKLFGVGAAVVPIVNGLPARDAEAKLIEVPKLEIPHAIEGTGTQMFLAADPPVGADYDCVLHMRDKRSGQSYRMDCDAILINTRRQAIDVSTWEDGGPGRRMMAGLSEMTFIATGKPYIAIRGVSDLKVNHGS